MNSRGLGKRRRVKSRKRPGLPPGSVIYTGEGDTRRVSMTLIEYDSSAFELVKEATFDRACLARDSERVSWLNLDGVHDTGLLERLGAHFKIHPLSLEDLANAEQRPKLEEFDEYLFLVVKMIRFDEGQGCAVVEQVGIIVAKSFLITFQDQIEGDVFGSIRERIEHGRGRIRKSGTDYLLYAILDAIVDNYFSVIERIGARVEKLEDELIEKPSPEGLKSLYQLKNEVYFLRRYVWPLREVVSQLAKREVHLVGESAGVYLRDVYDHTIQVIESVEMLRDVLSELVDIYLSSISHRMNSVMKVLTIITTIFMPLSFIAGVYGMNFEHMPELRWRYGYPFALSVMTVAAFLMLVLFRRRRWL